MNKQAIQKILAKEIPQNQIFIDEPMSEHTSFKIGGTADIFVQVRDIEQLKYIIKVAKKQNIHLTVIGNGSNVLVKDKGIRGIVLKIELEEISIQAEPMDIAKEDRILTIDILEGKEIPETDDVIVMVGSGTKIGEIARKIIKRRDNRV